MKLPLNSFWSALGRRERFVVATLIIILVATLYSWLVQTAYQERRKLAASVITLKSRAAVVEQQASEIERIRTMPAQAASPTDLRTLVQAQANSAGISRALVKIQSSTPNRLEIEFGDIPFSAWTAWVGNLQSQHVALETCGIEALAQPGRVAVTATLTRAGVP